MFVPRGEGVVSKNVKTHVTPDGEAVGWDICGGETCHRHVSLTDLDDCPNHPVTPAHLKISIGGKGRKRESSREVG